MTSIYQQLNSVNDEDSLTCSSRSRLVESTRIQHSEYYRKLTVEEQIDVTVRAMEVIENATNLIFESRVFRPIVNQDATLTRLSNQDLMIFCKNAGYTVLKIKGSHEKDSFIAYITNYYTKM